MVRIGQKFWSRPSNYRRVHQRRKFQKFGEVFPPFFGDNQILSDTRRSGKWGGGSGGGSSNNEIYIFEGNLISGSIWIKNILKGHHYGLLLSPCRRWYNVNFHDFIDCRQRVSGGRRGPGTWGCDQPQKILKNVSTLLLVAGRFTTTISINVKFVSPNKYLSFVSPTPFLSPRYRPRGLRAKIKRLYRMNDKIEGNFGFRGNYFPENEWRGDGWMGLEWGTNTLL